MSGGRRRVATENVGVDGWDNGERVQGIMGFWGKVVW